jgi:hypothetical protein
MNRLLALFLLSACCATAQIETPGSGVGGSVGGGGGSSSISTNDNQFGPSVTLTLKSGLLLTNSYFYGLSTNVGTFVSAITYGSNIIYQPSRITTSSNITINLDGGSMQAVTITSDVSLSVTNVASGKNVSVFFNTTNTGEYKLIMPSNIRLFSGAVTNTITTNKSSVVSFTSFDGINSNLVVTVAIQP